MIPSQLDVNKKIAFFAPNLSGGGAERVISLLCTYFGNCGFQVDLILAKATGPYLDSIPESVRIIELKSKRVMFSVFPLVTYLRKEKPDILLTSQFHSSTAAIFAKKIARANTLIYFRLPSLLRPEGKKLTITELVRQWVYLKSSRYASLIVATSGSMAEEFSYYSNISKNKVCVIPNPVDISNVCKKSQEKNEHPWFQKGELPVILAVGRFVEVKDFETLIKAFSIVRGQVNARLVILGDGPLRDEYLQLAEELGVSEHLSMPGFVSNPYKYMRGCAVFTITSLSEGFPNVVVEAMSLGKKVVATNAKPGVSEILEYGKWGAIVPVKNYEELAEQIVVSIQCKNNKDTSIRAKCYSIEKIMGQYKVIFGLGE